MEMFARVLFSVISGQFSICILGSVPLLVLQVLWVDMQHNHDIAGYDHVNNT